MFDTHTILSTQQHAKSHAMAPNAIELNSPSLNPVSHMPLHGTYYLQCIQRRILEIYSIWRTHPGTRKLRGVDLTEGTCMPEHVLEE